MVGGAERYRWAHTAEICAAAFNAQPHRSSWISASLFNPYAEPEQEAKPPVGDISELKMLIPKKK